MSDSNEHISEESKGPKSNSLQDFDGYESSPEMHMVDGMEVSPDSKKILDYLMTSLSEHLEKEGSDSDPTDSEDSAKPSASKVYPRVKFLNETF